jgi:hypothetical protein
MPRPLTLIQQDNSNSERASGSTYKACNRPFASRTAANDFDTKWCYRTNTRVNTPCSHLHSFCATVVNSGLATKLTLTRVLRGKMGGSGPASDFILYRGTWLLLGWVLNGTLRMRPILIFLCPVVCNGPFPYYCLMRNTNYGAPHYALFPILLSLHPS